MEEREIDTSLLSQAYAEYVEMPGLQLTLKQASRLWSSDITRCAEVLETLVEASFLRRSGDSYVRADCGRMCA